MSSPAHKQRGFTLAEVTMALGVAAFCLVVVFGLLPVGLNSNQNAKEQTAAAGIASGIAADLRATPVTGSSEDSPFYNISVPAAGSAIRHNFFVAEDGSPASNADDARYRVNLWFYPPASGQKEATSVRIFITWPAVADSAISAEPVNFSGSFETMISLDRS